MIPRSLFLAPCVALCVGLGAGCAPDGATRGLTAEAAAPEANDPGVTGQLVATDRSTDPDAEAELVAPAGDGRVGASIGSGSDGSPMPTPSTATVIGDSIALSVQQPVTETIESFGIDVVAYDAVESRRMVSGRADLPSGSTAIKGVLDAGDDAELWIIALGTNDVWNSSDAEAVRADIEQLTALVPPDAYLIWVDTWVRDLDRGAVELNSLIRDVLADRPRSEVLDWHARAATDGLIISDGVHLTSEGETEWADMIGDALAATFDAR